MYRTIEHIGNVVNGHISSGPCDQKQPQQKTTFKQNYRLRIGWVRECVKINKIDLSGSMSHAVGVT